MGIETFRAGLYKRNGDGTLWWAEGLARETVKDTLLVIYYARDEKDPKDWWGTPLTAFNDSFTFAGD